MSAREPRLGRVGVPTGVAQGLVGVVGVVFGYFAWKSAGLAVLTGIALAGIAGWAIRRVRSRSRIRKQRQEENAALYRARMEDSLRLFWEASRDFVPGAWGRRDLETLRLLCLNLEEGEVLGARVSERLRAISSAYLSGTVDRLADVVTTSRLVRLDLEQSARLERAAAYLTAALEESTFRSGEAVSIFPQDVAEHARTILDTSLHLREQLVPRVVADLPAILSWLVAAKYQDRVSEDKLSVEIDDLAGVGRVVMRPFDLSRVLDDLLVKVFAHGRVDGKVEIRGSRRQVRVDLAISWHVDDRFRFYPGALLEASRIIGCYEGIMDLTEDPENSAVSLILSLPACTEVSGRSWPRASGSTG